MKFETIKIERIVATQEEKQKMQNGLEVLNAIDDVTNDSGNCDHCPLTKLCDNTPCQVGCLIHFSQKIFEKLIENT